MAGEKRRKAAKGALLLCLTAWLAGCSSVPQRWYLNGRPEAQFQADFLNCQAFAQGSLDAGAQGASSISQQSNAYNYQAAAAAGLAALLVGHNVANQKIVECMRAAGYTPAR